MQSAAVTASKEAPPEFLNRPHVHPPPSAGYFDVIVLGSGVSTAVPQLSHVLTGHCVNEHSKRKSDGQTVCEEAHRNPSSKNRRFNVSLLLRYRPSDGSRVRHIMIDAGKTMRQAALAFLPSLGLHYLDALLLTHGHADAMLGMDDLRDLQVIEHVEENGVHVGYKLADGAGPLQIVSNAVTLQRVREVFPYLSTQPEFLKPGVMQRRVAVMEFREAPDDNSVMDIAGLPVRFFPVWHGGRYVSLGFAFGCRPATKDGEEDGYSVIYISDVKEVPPETMAWLECVAGRGIDLLLVDALNRAGHPTHFSLDDAITFARQLKPTRTLLVGMDSCAIGDHEEVNEELSRLRSEGLDVQLAYDGMHLPEIQAVEHAGASIPDIPSWDGIAPRVVGRKHLIDSNGDGAPQKFLKGPVNDLANANCC